MHKCVASVSSQSHTASDYITLIMVYITCIIYNCINDSPILVIHTCIYVYCHIPPISEIMNSTVDIYSLLIIWPTYHMMEHYFMYTIFHVSWMIMASTYNKHIDGGNNPVIWMILVNILILHLLNQKHASIRYNLLEINNPDINILRHQNDFISNESKYYTFHQFKSKYSNEPYKLCFINVNIMPYTHTCNIVYVYSHKYAYMCMYKHEYISYYYCYYRCYCLIYHFERCKLCECICKLFVKLDNGWTNTNNFLVWWSDIW